jgi:hypothetical protein
MMKNEEPIVNRVEINSYSDRELFDYRHGGAFDRGSADSYYGRNINPHYYVGGTYDSDMIEKSQMTIKEIEDYLAGYEWNEKFGDKKEWV